MNITQTAELSDVQAAHARAIFNFRNHLTEKYELMRAAIDATQVMLPPLVAIITCYLTVDPRIADVLREFAQRAGTDENHKLVWRVKHRDDPTGPDVAEVWINYNYMSKHDLPNCIPYLIRMFRMDRHDGETCYSYCFYFTPRVLRLPFSGSDGLTIRLNAREAEYSNDVATDMHMIALVGLHRMIDK